MAAEQNLNELNTDEIAYRALWEVAIEHQRRGEYANSDIMLQKLLFNADQPSIIAARCYMLLATTDDGEVDFVGHAYEAVRICEQTVNESETFKEGRVG
jgi:hypothetical protein